MASPASRSLPDVPDVLYHVFSYLDPIHHSRYQHDQLYESRRALAVAARTCRGFTGPALDILWKRLPDDQPLADILCEVGIATREHGEEYIEFPGKKKPQRYQLPNQGGGGYRLRSLEAAYEQEWRLLRGYDIRYVSVMSPFMQAAPMKTRSASPYVGTLGTLGNTLAGLAS